ARRWGPAARATGSTCSRSRWRCPSRSTSSSTWSIRAWGSSGSRPSTARSSSSGRACTDPTFSLDCHLWTIYQTWMRTLSLLGLPLAFAVHAHGGTHLKKPRHGFQMRVDPYVIQPGQDLEVCEYRRLPLKKPMDVSEFEVRMPPGAHHFALWGYGGDVRDDSLFPKGPVDAVGCIGVAPDNDFPQLIIPTQSPSVKLPFPPGIALHLEPHQQVLLNPHMKNFGTEPLTPDIRFNFRRAKKGTIKHYAEGLTFGNTFGIHIPAGGDQTITVEWTAPINLTIIHLATHQHRLGTYARID